MVEVNAEKSIINYVNMNITAMTAKEEDDFLNFMKERVTVKPIFKQAHTEGE